jgi:dihydrofolate reductase
MRKLIVSEFVTLDGVMQSPESWVFAFHDEQTGQYKTGEMHEVDALLLGRATYDIFAASWPNLTGELADQMNSVAKYVVCTAPENLSWHNSQTLTGDVVPATAALKSQPGRNILIAGSGMLVQTLLQHALIDEYRLLLCPLTLGTGQRLFTPDASARLALAETRAFATGAVLLRYTAA